MNAVRTLGIKTGDHATDLIGPRDLRDLDLKHTTRTKTSGMSPEQNATSAVGGVKRIHVQAPGYETDEERARLKLMVRGTAQGNGFRRLVVHGHLWMKMGERGLEILNKEPAEKDFDETHHYDIGGRSRQKHLVIRPFMTGSNTLSTTTITEESLLALGCPSGSAWVSLVVYFAQSKVN